jgi:MerR family regulatory protein
MLELKVSFKSTIYIRGRVGGNEMKIGELAGRSRLNASAIRYYERRGLLPVPTVRAANGATPRTLGIGGLGVAGRGE